MLLNSDTSWGTEGPWEMLRHYNIASVMTDSPPSENLQFLSDVIITANWSFIRFHGRNTKGHYWYNYLYSEQELKPSVEKVNQTNKQIQSMSTIMNTKMDTFTDTIITTTDTTTDTIITTTDTTTDTIITTTDTTRRTAHQEP